MKPISRRVLPGNAQHVGDREYQEDAFGFTSQEDPQFLRHAGVAAVLCDGMGGLQFGAEAAAIGVDTFLDEYRRKLPEELPSEALKRCAIRSNEAVYRFAERNGVVKKTGCTLVAVVVRGSELHCVHVGDSRAYLLSGDRLDRLTEDHSYGRTLQRQVDAGTISETAADTHPLKDHLVSNLGRPTLEGLDVMHPPRRLVPHDCVMLCSDGLHGVLSDEEIAAAIRGSSQEAAQRLVDRVLASGQPDKDNVTVVMLQVQPDGSVKHDHRLSRTFVPETPLLASPAIRGAGIHEKPVQKATGVRTKQRVVVLASLALAPLLLAAAVWALWPTPVPRPAAPTVSGITPQMPATVGGQGSATNAMLESSTTLPEVKSTAPSTFTGSKLQATGEDPKNRKDLPASTAPKPVARDSSTSHKGSGTGGSPGIRVDGKGPPTAGTVQNKPGPPSVPLSAPPTPEPVGAAGPHTTRPGSITENRGSVAPVDPYWYSQKPLEEKLTSEPKHSPVNKPSVDP